MRAVAKPNSNPASASYSAPWPKVKVGDALELINGRAFKPSEWTKTGTPIVRIQNLNNPDALYNYYQGELPEKISLNDGDLLFAWSGTPGTSFGAHIWRGGKAWLNQHIFKVLFDETQFDKRFLQLAINQNLAEYIRAAHGGAGLAHITKGRFEESVLPRPSLPEQRRIVAEIEKQFSRLEEGVGALRRVQANLKRYRAAVLKAACEGKLVPTEAEIAKSKKRKFETGEELLARILAERRKNWQGRGKYKEPAAPDTAKLPPLPEGWAVASVEQLAIKVVDGTHHTPTYMDDGIAFISVKDIRAGIVHFDNCKFITAEAHNELIKRCHPEKGDILITKSGTIGRSAVVVTDRPFSLFVSVALIKPVRGIFDPKFLKTALDAYIGGINISQDIKGALLKNLHLEDLCVVPIRLPPLAEQSRIVAEVERRLSVVEELEATVEANLQRAARLRQSILQKAFAGGLV